MSPRRLVRFLLLPGAALAWSIATPALAADMTKAQCIEANTRGQDLRRDSRLTAAREQLLACASSSCPTLVREDCTRRLSEVERAQPTIVFAVKDAAGQDVSTVRLTVDGKPLADRLAGAQLAVDPGQHVFVFTAAGQSPETRTYVLREGERDRRESIVLGGGAAPRPASLPAPVGDDAAQSPVPGAVVSAAPDTPTEGNAARTRKIVGLAGVGAGAVAIAVGSIFGLKTISDAGQQRTDCTSATSCNDHAQALSDHSAGSTDGAIATVAFIAGGALVAAGVALFLTAARTQGSSGTGVVLEPTLAPHAGGAAILGRF